MPDLVPEQLRADVVADIEAGMYPDVELTDDPPDTNPDHGHNEPHEMDAAGPPEG